MKEKTIRCSVCEIEFVTESTVRKTCSDNCKKLWAVSSKYILKRKCDPEKKKEKTKPNKKVCKTCGALTDSSKKEYCSAKCKKIMHNFLKLKKYHEEKGNWDVLSSLTMGDPNEKRYCKHCNVLIEDSITKIYCSDECKKNYAIAQKQQREEEAFKRKQEREKLKKEREAAAEKLVSQSVIDKQCLFCLTSFSSTIYSRKKYCSVTCREKHIKQLIEERQIVKIKTCPTCNETFQVKGGGKGKSGKIFCSPRCQKIAYKAKMSGEEISDLLKVRHCQLCGNEILNGNMKICQDCAAKKIAYKDETIYNRVCTDCKIPTNNHRCPSCLRAWQIKHKVINVSDGEE